MEDLRLQLPRMGLKVNNVYSDVRIMSGRDEGVNAWITVNYLAKKLGTVSTILCTQTTCSALAPLRTGFASLAFTNCLSLPKPRLIRIRECVLSLMRNVHF